MNSKEFPVQADKQLNGTAGAGRALCLLPAHASGAGRALRLLPAHASGAARTVEFKNKMMEAYLPDVLQKTAFQGELLQDTVDFNPVQ
jgi:hypothetical protein